VHSPNRAHALVILVALAASSFHAGAGQQLNWQADVQIRTLEVTRAKTALSVRVVVYTEDDDEARDVRLLVLLPVGAGIQRLGAGCVASSGPPMVPALRATVTCELGSIADRAFHEVVLTISRPPEGTPTRLGVFAYSSTPDPRPANNFAERVLP